MAIKKLLSSGFLYIAQMISKLPWDTSLAWSRVEGPPRLFIGFLPYAISSKADIMFFHGLTMKEFDNTSNTLPWNWLGLDISWQMLV